MSYTGKNAYSAGKTSGVLRGGALGANKKYVLAHCAPPKRAYRILARSLNRFLILSDFNEQNDFIYFFQLIQAVPLATQILLLILVHNNFWKGSKV